MARTSLAAGPAQASDRRRRRESIGREVAHGRARLSAASARRRRSPEMTRAIESSICDRSPEIGSSGFPWVHRMVCVRSITCVDLLVHAEIRCLSIWSIRLSTSDVRDFRQRCESSQPWATPTELAVEAGSGGTIRSRMPGTGRHTGANGVANSSCGAYGSLAVGQAGM